MSQIHLLSSFSLFIQQGCCDGQCQVIITFCIQMKVPCYHSSIRISSIQLSVVQQLTVLEAIQPLRSSLFVVHHSYYKINIINNEILSAIQLSTACTEMPQYVIQNVGCTECNMHGWVSLSIVSCFIIVLLLIQVPLSVKMA